MSFSACTQALVKKPIKPSLLPCFFSNTSLYCARIAMMWLMSTSLKVVSMAAVFCTSFSRRAMVWRSRGPVVDLPEQCADGDRLAVLGDDLAQRAGRGRGDFDGDLVGLKLDQRLVDRNRIAGLLEPAADGRLGDGLA